nr:helix-turn-helix domain-containing protein [uncultured Desulfuromonas sp.]
MATYSSSEITKDTLIEAAGQLIADLGLSAVSVRAIASRAKENIGTIHYHFGNKEGLFAEVINKVIERWEAAPLKNELAPLDLTNRNDQAMAIRRIVERMSRLIFSSRAPEWHREVIYQVMQHPGPLQEMFRERVITPENTLTVHLFQRIDQSLSFEQAYAHTLTIQSSLIVHADYQNAVLRELQQTDYSREYIAYMENILISQKQKFFDLPLV